MSKEANERKKERKRSSLGETIRQTSYEHTTLPPQVRLMVPLAQDCLLRAAEALHGLPFRGDAKDHIWDLRHVKLPKLYWHNPARAVRREQEKSITHCGE